MRSPPSVAARALAALIFLHPSVCDDASVIDGDRPTFDGYQIIRHGGVDDIVEDFGYGKIHQAVLIGYTARVRYLLKQGANPDLMTKRGTAMSQKKFGTTEGNTPLSLAADLGFADICELLIQAGARIDHRTFADNTPLFLAASRGYTTIIRMLLRAGASVDRRGASMGDGDTSDTPLTRAAYHGYPEPTRLLLEAGAAVDARSEPSGGTALHEAVLHGSQCHSDPGYSHGQPLIKAGHEETITLLIAHGAALDLRNHQGETPLFAAVSMGCLHIVKQLIQAGANVDIACRPAATKPGIGIEGQTPLIAAATFGEVEMAQELLNAGASLHLRDITGSTAMDWAVGTCDENERFDCAARQVAKRQISKLLRAEMRKRGKHEERSALPTERPSKYKHLYARPTSDDRSGASTVALWSPILVLLVAGALVLLPLQHRQVLVTRVIDLAAIAFGRPGSAQGPHGTARRAAAAARRRQRRQAAVAARPAVPAPSPEPAIAVPSPGADGQCIVCLDASMRHTFVPCGHYCVCASCAAEIMSSPAPRCPLCREVCESSMRVFPSGTR